VAATAPTQEEMLDPPRPMTVTTIAASLQAKGAVLGGPWGFFEDGLDFWDICDNLHVWIHLHGCPT